MPNQPHAPNTPTPKPAMLDALAAGWNLEGSLAERGGILSRVSPKPHKYWLNRCSQRADIEPSQEIPVLMAFFQP